MSPNKRLFLVMVLTLVSHAAWARRPLLLAFELPSRRSSVTPDTATLEELARDVARRLSSDLVAQDTSIDEELAARLGRARTLALGGSLDEAASALDAALEDGARKVHRIAKARAEFVAGHLRRAVIGLARGERERVVALLERVLRYQPDLELTRAEATPELRALFDATRARLGDRPELLAETVSEACTRLADVVLVARRIGDSLWVTRFDRCRQTAEVSIADRQNAIEALSRASVSFNPAILGVEPLSSSVPARRGARVYRIAGLTTLGVGAALLATGIYFGAHASSLRGSFNAQCGAAGCSSDELISRGDAVHSAETTSAVLSSLGAAAVIAGGVVTYLGFRRASARIGMYVPRIFASPSTIGGSWSCAF